MDASKPKRIRPTKPLRSILKGLPSLGQGWFVREPTLDLDQRKAINLARVELEFGMTEPRAIHVVIILVAKA